MSRARIADAAAGGLAMVVVGLGYLVLWTATGWHPPQAPSFSSTVVATTVVAVLARPAFGKLRGAVRRWAGVPLVSVPRSVRGTIDAGRSAGSADEVGPRMLAALGTELRPLRAELWAGPGARGRLIAVWPADEFPPSEPAPSGPTVERTLRHAGHQLGLLRATLRHSDPAQDELLDAWCDQAGQVLAVVARREDLRRREAALVRRRRLLRLSRTRLAAAERTARRRLERDLHDGAQQHLLAVGLALQVARRSAGHSPDRARASLERAVELARRSADELARVSAALYPDRLRTGDLGAVLRHAVAHGDLAVTVDAGPGGVGDELTGEVRTALYFVAMEALQNAVKHGRAAHAAIRLWSDQDSIHLEIGDDGVGLAATAGSRQTGSGLRQLDERLREVGGRLTVAPAPHGGTTVTASVPRARATGRPATRVDRPGRDRADRAGESVSA